jgi:hypothetical protein
MEASTINNQIRVDWPLWAKIYAVIIGAPMVAVSIGVAIVMPLNRFGGLTEDSETLGVVMFTAAFVVTFLMAAWLFFIGIVRTVNRHIEALTFAATGHLIIGAPALVYLVVRFAQDDEAFFNKLSFAAGDLNFIIEFRLICWVIFHIYFALFLAVNDTTWQYLDEGEG